MARSLKRTICWWSFNEKVEALNASGKRSN